MGWFDGGERVPVVERGHHFPERRRAVVGQGQRDAHAHAHLARKLLRRQELEDERSLAKWNDRRAVSLECMKQSGTNMVQVSEAIKDAVAELQQELPEGLQMDIVIDNSFFVTKSIDEVKKNQIEGAFFAGLVIFFFLRNLRSTLVISLAIPISVIATFGLLYFGGFTLNLMTLGGLTLGVGMMVDSSVVVLENIFRRQQEQGESPAEAAVRGTGEVASAVVAGTVTTLVIFLPLIFVQGVSGVLCKELAYVIMFALFCALLVSLSLVPMLGSRLLQGGGAVAGNAKGAAFGGLAQWAGGLFAALENSYRQLLQGVLRHRLVTILSALALFGASLLLTPFIGPGEAP